MVESSDMRSVAVARSFLERLAPKRAPCFYLHNVECPHPKREKLRSLDYRCFQCRYFKKWEKTMDQEDERMMNEVDRIRENPEAYLRGELK